MKLACQAGIFLLFLLFLGEGAERYHRIVAVLSKQATYRVRSTSCRFCCAPSQSAGLVDVACKVDWNRRRTPESRAAHKEDQLPQARIAWERLVPEVKPGELQLTIHPEIIPGSSKRLKKTFSLYRTTLTDMNGERELNHRPLFSGTMPRDLQIVVKVDDGEPKELALTNLVKKRLIEYLILGPPRRPFDCGSFVHFLYGVNHRFGNYESDRWREKPIMAENALRSGDAVFLSRSAEIHPKAITHFAVYLADGRYLSKLGTDGPIGVGDLATMRKIYGGSFLFQIEPVEQL